MTGRRSVIPKDATIEPVRPANDGADGLSALRRALAVLKALAQTGPLGTRLSEIASATGLPLSTTHRLLKGLAAEGMVLREASAGRLYKLGPFALGLGPDATAHQYDWFAAICRPSLQRLAAATGHAAQLTVRIGRSGLSLGIVAGSAPPHPAFAKAGAVGFMGFGSASVVLLAALAEPQVEEILWDNEWLLEQAGIERATLDGLIAAARRDGHCYSERVFVPDLCALSKCIPNGGAAPYAALSLLAIADRLEPAGRAGMLGHLDREATFIARAVERAQATG